MREIEFRGKRVSNSEWHYGFYREFTVLESWIKEAYRDGVNYYIDAPGTNECHLVDPETVGQYTGLKDKNGKKIYEGDICKDNLGWIFEVIWDDQDARFLGRLNKKKGDVCICYVSREPTVEVIGNIHDNPELLESEVK